MKFAAVSIVTFLCLLSTVLSAFVGIDLSGLTGGGSGQVAGATIANEEAAVVGLASDNQNTPLLGFATPGFGFGAAIPSPTA